MYLHTHGAASVHHEAVDLGLDERDVWDRSQQDLCFAEHHGTPECSCRVRLAGQEIVAACGLDIQAARFLQPALSQYSATYLTCTGAATAVLESGRTIPPMPQQGAGDTMHRTIGTSYREECWRVAARAAVLGTLPWRGELPATKSILPSAAAAAWAVAPGGPSARHVPLPLPSLTAAPPLSFFACRLAPSALVRMAPASLLFLGYLAMLGWRSVSGSCLVIRWHCRYV